ncbi:MAG: LCP family protein [Candidatus Gracilibacteria bacterium]|nr:LCP family protein [Candidatus Gracilibacteria bacterium]
MGFLSRNFSKQNLFAISVLVILVLVLLQMSALSYKVSNFSEKNSSMIKEIGMVREANMAFGNDMNEMRKRLLLPEKNYFNVEQEPSSGETDTNTDKLQLQMFKYVDFLGQSAKKVETVKTYEDMLSKLSLSETIKTFLTENSLSQGEFTNTDSISQISYFSGEIEILKYYLDKNEGELVFKSPLERTEKSFANLAEMESFSIDYMQKNKDRIIEKVDSLKAFRKSVSDAFAKNEVVDFMKSKGFSFSEFSDTVSDIFVLNSNGDKLAQITLNDSELSATLLDFSDTKNKIIASDLSVSLLPFLQKLNSLSGILLEVENQKKKISELISDKGFQLSLKENGLKITDTPEEDNIRIYYKIYDSTDAHISSIVIEKTTGVVNIVQPNGTNSENLLYFEPEEKKKTIEIPEDIPDYGEGAVSEEGSFNILIAGKHGNLVDTMIFTHIDEKTKKIKMISIPRDLFYNGRKINAFGYFYGMDELKKVLSDMTGYKLDKYILIDMYAFIDVIDLIGGIDITLEKAVIDPTYRTVDNGVEGTLHYEPGDYHLGGKEALRLARTRHTSSDFARAERQQMILEALQDKAKNFGFGDADTFYKIAKAVLSKTETDVGFDEAIAYYFKYQGFDIVSNNVMSSGNVLYVPPYTTREQCEAKIAAAKASGSAIPNCMNENQAYTLLPRNNNWNIVKWFFRENFEEETA